ncbi:alkaline phosphatase [Levilactobacillus bambusae]|uniref:Alkaline phosphatase n=2 Tax=Levilactobacillus bambusae TaxID=2024736 RepID=A0A2V1MZY5_9LACO|nr:LTA synthase family protein [Levilactobacillus bambusae]PWG00581.1 alkaline phosphatase [Levilactobacillus bambusae]
MFWLKTLFAYFIDFNLGLEDPLQFFIVLINPIATTALIIGLALYIKPARLFYPISIFLDILNTVLLYLNVIYFREFTDFMTVSTMLGYDKVNQGLSGSSIALTNIHDIFYWLDIVIVLVCLAFHYIHIDLRPLNWRVGAAFSSAAVLLFMTNLGIAEMNRPQLLTRMFDRTYLVKYLGLDAFTVYDGIRSQHTNELRATAKKSELTSIEAFTDKHYAKPDPKLYGIAKHKNVIVIHLESFQQFLIGKKVNGQEVTPFLNKLYRSQSTYSFDNFFHQVGQGKTSDAENMLETSTYGLPQGSLFASLGSDNTFQAAPAILNQRAGYTSAVFHGNVASFWNRNNVYKNMGYQYFFDASYYDTSGDKATGYGLKDKLLFKDSVSYLQRLQQPFYVKYITVSNHFPYSLDSEDTSFKTTDTGDSTVDNYFQTAHYLDQSVQEFYQYLNKSGLAKNSIVMLYGDHYGISDSENKSLAKALNVDPDDWTDYDNAQLQRVPLMFNMPGYKKGRVEHQYGGEIDVLPTLLHLLGISSKRYIQFGTDLFSKQHDQVVAFRNKDWVDPDYTSLSGTIYSNKTKQEIHPKGKQEKQIKADQKKVNTELSLSDSLNEKNLLRFYHPKGFKAVNAGDYNYANGLDKAIDIEKKLGVKSTDLYTGNRDHTTTNWYETDAPEVAHKSTNSNRIKITNPDANSASNPN